LQSLLRDLPAAVADGLAFARWKPKASGAAASFAALMHHPLALELVLIRRWREMAHARRPI
jgi:hypothetical protein